MYTVGFLCFSLRIHFFQGTILKATVDYVKTLKRENDRMAAIEERQKFLENQNKQLVLRIHQLEVQVSRWEGRGDKAAALVQLLRPYNSYIFIIRSSLDRICSAI